MAKRRVVRVVVFREECHVLHRHDGSDGLCRDRDAGRLWIEQLRYAGVIKILRDDKEKLVFDIIPHHLKSGTEFWAKSNAERMRSFGINAADAPEWAGGGFEERELLSEPCPFHGSEHKRLQINDQGERRMCR